VCAGNVKQVGLGELCYVDDYAGFMATNSARINAIWEYNSRKFASDIFFCPSDTLPWSRNPYSDGIPSHYFYGSVGYNYFHYKTPGADKVLDGKRFSMVGKPSQFIMWGDSGTVDWEITNVVPLTSYTVILPRVVDNRPLAIRHSGGSNIFFADGHVIKMLYRQVATESPGWTNYENSIFWTLSGEKFD